MEGRKFSISGNRHNKKKIMLLKITSVLRISKLEGEVKLNIKYVILQHFLEHSNCYNLYEIKEL